MFITKPSSAPSIFFRSYLHICGQQLAFHRLRFWDVRGVKIGTKSRDILRRSGGRFWGRKWFQNRGPEAPSRPPGPSWRRHGSAGCFRTRFGAYFGSVLDPLGIVKIVLPSRRGATFYKNRRTRSGAPNRLQNDPQNELKFGPKWTPGGPRRAKSVVQSGARF